MQQQLNSNKSKEIYTHTQTKPKQSKEKKIQESDPASKGNQKCYLPNKNKTNLKN